MRMPIALLLSLAAAGMRAQPADEAAARAFRDRVVQLALIYGESSGIDLAGDKVEAREVRKLDERCADVEVVILRGREEVRREVVRACKAH